MSKTGVVKGFKVFNPDWTCNPNGKPFQYEVGRIYEEDVKPECCSRGFHFCTKASDCFDYYKFDPNNKVAKLQEFAMLIQEPLQNVSHLLKRLHPTSPKGKRIYARW